MRTVYSIHALVGAVLLCTLAGHASAAEAANWEQFRGPGGNGIADTTEHPVAWSEEQNIDWKINIEGVGWAQPIVWGDQAFVFSAVTEKQPQPRRGEAGPGFTLFSREGISRSLLGGGEPPAATYEWKLICLDVKNGESRWEKMIRRSRPAVPTHRSNSYASETPVTDGSLIYVSLGMSAIYCFDMEGTEIWSHPVDSHSMQFGWGTGSSPLLYEDLLIVLCDNEESSYLMALDKRSGDERWRVERKEQSGWSTPYLWRNEKRVELIACGGKKSRSYDPETGEQLWELDATGRVAITPVGNRELLYVGSVTRNTGTAGLLAAVRPGSQGELSVDEANDAIAWSLPRTSSELSSPLLYQGRLYLLKQGGGIITCLDAETGERIYRKRLPGAGGFTASPWAADGKVFCLDENGTTFVIAAAGDYQLIGTNKLDGMFWGSAAVADDALLLRSAEHLYRISSH